MDLPLQLISDEQIEQFGESGYFVTPPVFEEAQLAAMSAEFDRLWQDGIRDAERLGDERHSRLMRLRPFIGQAHEKSAVCAAFVKSPIYLEACAKLVGPDADLYYNQAVIKPPTEGKHFGWHQDSGYTETRPLEYITCWTAISRCFIENGCIWVIPGSHKRGLRRHEHNKIDDSIDAVIEDEIGAIPVEMEPGQVAIFSSLLLHKSGPNTSPEIRRGYVPQYHQPDVVLVENGEFFGDRYPVLRDGQPV